MAPKEPTRAQLSSRLSYSQNTPAFLRKLQNRVAGRPDGYDDDNEEPQVANADDFDEGGLDEFGRERRPPIPQRPPGDRGSGDEGAKGSDEDFDDEKPQVVVLKQGKHLTEREAENIRRREKGLPPLPIDDAPNADSSSEAVNQDVGSKSKPKADPKQSLSFSSGKTTKPTKRKAVAIGGNASDGDDDLVAAAKKLKKPKTKGKEKAKGNKKTLLSFGDDA
ncbi:hypothetical protein HGRIS_000924 [Hohenbuehelia grisea]|uniref:DUF4604 domain-containing protein n=1 Tax=Hohenbuehelia grisea TaxID=104357 RepID=A0ABR3IQ94_9AGAR